MSGVVSCRAAELVSAFPGADVHELLGVQYPGKEAVAIVPVVLPLTEPRISTGIAGGRSGAIVLELVGAAVEPDMGLAPIGLIAVAFVERRVSGLLFAPESDQAGAEDQHG
jgi:hypothetical protein